MQTQKDESAVLPPPRDAANDEFLSLRNDATRSGWDPYEVWHARIKAVYDLRVRSARQRLADHVIGAADTAWYGPALPK